MNWEKNSSDAEWNAGKAVFSPGSGLRRRGQSTDVPGQAGMSPSGAMILMECSSPGQPVKRCVEAFRHPAGDSAAQFGVCPCSA